MLPQPHKHIFPVFCRSKAQNARAHEPFQLLPQQNIHNFVAGTPKCTLNAEQDCAGQKQYRAKGSEMRIWKHAKGFFLLKMRPQLLRSLKLLDDIFHNFVHVKVLHRCERSFQILHTYKKGTKINIFKFDFSSFTFTRDVYLSV